MTRLGLDFGSRIGKSPGVLSVSLTAAVDPFTEPAVFTVVLSEFGTAVAVVSSLSGIHVKNPLIVF